MIMILIYIGGKGIVTGTMETGALTSIIVYALQIIGSLMMVTFVFVMIMIAGASTDRIVEVLNEIPEMRDPADAVTSVADGDIIFDHVSFSYAGEGGNLSLKDVNLHIKSGQTVGIIGGTGSAKSTLVQLIPRLYDVTEGSVKVSGIDVRKYGATKMLRMKKYRMSVNWHRPTDSSANFRMVTIHRLSRVETTYPVGRNSVFVLPVPC